jgi:hypothetical protein
VTEDAVAEAVTCGPDPRKHLEAIEKATKAGYTHVCIHQIGPDQIGFLEFCEREILPELGGRASARRKPVAKVPRSARRQAMRARASR